jgi:PAS domain S-box-containing protein
MRGAGCFRATMARVSEGDAREDAAAPDPALLLALIPDGLWIFDDRGVTTWANDKMAELLGRDPAEMVGLRVEEVLDEQGRRDFAHHLAEMVRGGTPRDNVDAYFVRPDGTTVWGLLSYVPVPSGPGAPGGAGGRAGWLHRVTPYTERKELLDALAAREQQLATAQSIAHIGSWSWDVSGDGVEWSDEMCRILGLPEGTAGSYDGYLARVHRADRDGLVASIEGAVARGDGFAYDHRLVRDGGDVRWVRARGLVDRDTDGRAVRVSGTSQDITDLRKADDQAVRATRRLRALQGMTTAANRATTLQEALVEAATMLTASTTWTLVGAYVSEPTPGQEATVDLRVGDVPVELDRTLADRAADTGEITIGDPVPALPGRRLVALPIRLRGETVCVVEAVAEEERGLEQETYRLIEQMGQQLAAVADRERSAAQLAEARDQAMEASRLKSEFLATMSHEIRTPMNGVVGLTDLLLRTDLDEHQRRLAENLQGAGLTLLGIINDILDLSKIEAGKLELEDVAFDVREVLDQLASVLGGPARDKGLELVIGCAPDVPAQLRGDPVRFGQVVTNLGANAVKFTDSGEVVVRASVDSRDAGDLVLRVTVSDTGVGISHDARDRLFDAFVQADPSTTRRHGGTGLGLAISRQLAEALGGGIEVESEPGRGSTFSFTARLGLVDGAATAAPVARSLTGRRVLVVDDNATNRLILTEQLQGWEMDVEAVATGADALAALARAGRSRRPFDLAVLDMVMPHGDGLQLARAVRADPDLGPVPMVLLTSDESVDRDAIVRAGVHSALSKPVRHTELRGALLAALGSVGSREDAEPAEDPGRPTTTTTTGLGVAVLVVEDNPVNQLVATGFLEHLGCRVDVASDGLEAVRLLTRPHEYAAVLMDCRMPRLDGYDATRQVRAHEPVGRRVPIIAMTASALEGERERCLDAGMDDFLTKPVDAAELERVVREWARPGAPADGNRGPGRLEGAAAPGPAAPTAAPAAAPVLDPDERADRMAALLGDQDGVLDADRVATLDELVKDGVSFFERTAASFLVRADGQVAAVREAVDRSDATELVSAAHQLKGSASNLGLPRVAAVAADLEALGLAGTTDGAAGLVAILGSEVDAAVAALRRVTAGIVRG